MSAKQSVQRDSGRGRWSTSPWSCSRRHALGGCLVALAAVATALVASGDEPGSPGAPGAPSVPSGSGEHAVTAPVGAIFHIRIAQGEAGGTYRAASLALAEMVNQERGSRGIAVDLVEGAGSIDHIRKLAAGEADAALVQADVFVDALEGRGAFVEPVEGVAAVGVLFPEVVHVLARKGSGLTTVADLAGRAVAAGGPGSGTAASARHLLELHGLGAAEVKLHALATAESLDALARGQVDAVVFTSIAPSPRVADLLARGVVELVPPAPQATARLAASAVLRPTTLTPADYPGLPEGGVAAVTVEAVLAVRTGVPDMIGAALAELLAAEPTKARLQALHARILTKDPGTAVASLPLPLQRGADDYYRATASFEAPVKVYVGIMVVAITNLDMKSGTFDVDMYLWFRWRGRIADAGPEEQLPWELANGALNTKVLNSLEQLGGWTYLCYRVGATMRGQFLLHEYPFDNQVLTIEVESGDHATDEVVFLAEEHDLSGRPRDLWRHALSPRVSISDWQIVSLSQRAEAYVYDSDFGSPEMAAQGVLSFPRFSFTIEIRRVLFPYLVKFCLPLVIIVMMSFLVFFIRPEEFEVQAGIVITALLSVVAFHVSQADSLPEVGYLVTADKFFMLSYVVIFLTLVEVVIENRLLHRKGEYAARRLDHFARIAFPVAFFGPIAYMIASRL